VGNGTDAQCTIMLELALVEIGNVRVRHSMGNDSIKVIGNRQSNLHVEKPFMTVK
jgi:hypothetical protein